MKLYQHPDEEDDSEDIIGQALNLLDDSPPPAIEMKSFFSVPVDSAGDRVNRVRNHLNFLLDDGLDEVLPDSFEPAAELRGRTLSRIREFQALQEEFHEPLQYQPRWRVADVAVAASVLIALVLGSIPPIQRAQFSAANMACSANLSQLWRGLEQYSSTFNVYPSAVAQNRRLPVGATLALMRHTGHLDETVAVTCPACANEVQAGELPHWNELNAMKAEMLRKLSDLTADAYAMHPGIGGQDGIRHLDRARIEIMKSMVPLLGDRPQMDSNRRVKAGNSLTHGGLGQNVIFADGHTMFLRNRSVNRMDNDVYTNRHGQADAAIDYTDVILVPASEILQKY